MGGGVLLLVGCLFGSKTPSFHFPPSKSLPSCFELFVFFPPPPPVPVFTDAIDADNLKRVFTAADVKVILDLLERVVRNEKTNLCGSLLKWIACFHCFIHGLFPSIPLYSFPLATTHILADLLNRPEVLTW